MKNITFIIVVFVSMMSCSQQGYNEEKIQAVVEKYIDNGTFNGTLVIANKDSIVYQASNGNANVGTKESITANTAFPLASVTKQFTATAILLLHESGKLSIDDKLSKYIEIPTYMEQVLVKNLLNHTSGIPDYWQNEIESNEESIFKFLYAQDSLLFKSNTDYAYSNSGYFLLGKLIESLSDTTYAGFMKEEIFKPLGMTNTFVYIGNDSNIVQGYNLNGEVEEQLISSADGGIISTANDLQKWNISLIENSLLKAETKQLMFEPAVLENGTTLKKGFGWELGFKQVSIFEMLTGKYNNIVSHTGGLSSYGAYNQYDYDQGIYFTLLTNQVRPELMEMIKEINKALY